MTLLNSQRPPWAGTGVSAQGGSHPLFSPRQGISQCWAGIVAVLGPLRCGQCLPCLAREAGTVPKEGLYSSSGVEGSHPGPPLCLIVSEGIKVRATRNHLRLSFTNQNRRIAYLHLRFPCEIPAEICLKTWLEMFGTVQKIGSYCYSAAWKHGGGRARPCIWCSDRLIAIRSQLCYLFCLGCSLCMATSGPLIGGRTSGWILLVFTN